MESTLPAARITAPDPVVDPLTGRHRTESVVGYLLMIAALTAALPAVGVVGMLFWKGFPALSWEFLTAMPIHGMTAGGIYPCIVGTVWLVGVSLMFSVPIGILAGVYLAEYAGNSRVARVVELAIVNLAAVPSIVHALFGLGMFVLFLHLGTSILAAGATLSVMTMPVIITATRSAMQGVPHPFRVACWNLGATRWQTIRHVVLPNALPGILTGVILEVSRAAGETAPILFTGAAFYLPILPRGFGSQTMALSTHVYALSTQIPNASEQLKFGTALVLLLVVLAFNSVSIAFRVYLRRNRRW
ncbi:MAG: phosphate ABC transporter permease PstA, partial [Myxococcota bacterium]